MSHAVRKSESLISLNRSTGRVTLKLKEFKVFVKGSSITFRFFKIYPITMIRKTGMVAFRLNIRFSMGHLLTDVIIKEYKSVWQICQLQIERAELSEWILI